MEHISKAVERSKVSLAPDAQFPEFQQANPRMNARDNLRGATEVTLNANHLEGKRIIAHDIADPRSRSFDMLRTQVLQSMDMKSWQFVGVTSPTEGCGKSVVSTNLALSIARQAERSVLLADMDLQKPQIASYLGVNCNQGILSALQGGTSLQQSIIEAKIGTQKLAVLPCEAPTPNSSERVSSRAMRELLQQIKRELRGSTIVVDLPPLLSSDDVISVLPQLDCVLFVVGAGITTAEDIKESNRHLEATEVVRVVLNKVEDPIVAYYAYPRYVSGSADRRPG